MELNPKRSSSFGIGYLDDYDYEQINEELTVNTAQESNNFINESDLIKEREAMIEVAKEKLFLERNPAILAMIYYKWNEDKLDNWYEDIEQNKVNAGIELSNKLKLKFKVQNIPSNGEECLICSENENLFSLNCGHKFCDDCWKEYLTEKIKMPLGALQVTCPQNECSCFVFEEIYKKYLKDEILLEKLDKAIYKNFINRNDDIKQCPNNHCHLYVKSNMHSAREINCPCGTSYCFKCSKESHRPCTCEIIEKWEKLCISDSSDEKWIQANTKECPHCHQKIEKSHGCNFMLCDKRAGGCGHAFCYVCETDWEKHSKDHFTCNKYTEEVKNKEKNSEKLKKDLKRYEFYFTRYMNYKKAVEECNEKFRKDLGEKINILITIKNLPVIETSFIIDALETIIKAKRTLKNTYIFGFYMNDTQKKELFEYSQGLLESNSEKLHKFLIDEHLNDLIETDSFGDYNKKFNEFKNDLNNLISIINNYMKKLIDEIENQYISELNNELLDQKV